MVRRRRSCSATIIATPIRPSARKMSRSPCVLASVVPGPRASSAGAVGVASTGRAVTGVGAGFGVVVGEGVATVVDGVTVDGEVVAGVVVGGGVVDGEIVDCAIADTGRPERSVTVTN